MQCWAAFPLIIIMDDPNADPGSEGGPLSSTPANEQGRILLRYLQRWNYLSVHTSMIETVAYCRM